jgi:putative toxin-antitoxin system antitoxin component (TIGR02293 family)
MQAKTFIDLLGGPTAFRAVAARGRQKYAKSKIVKAAGRKPSPRLARQPRARTPEAAAALTLAPHERWVVAYRSVESLSKRLGVDPTAFLAEVIDVAPRTALRRKEEGYLDPDESDRILRVARVAVRAEEVLGSERNAADWLRTENPALGGYAPLSLLASDAGTELVTDELGRIEYGDLV